MKLANKIYSTINLILLAKQSYIAIIIFSMLTACATQPLTQLTYSLNPAIYANVDTSNLNELTHLHQQQTAKTKSKEEDVNPMRAAGLQEAALALGAQGALSKRSQDLDQLLEKNQHYLNQIFNFNALLLDNDVLPPVIAASNNSLNLENNDTIRVADKIYVIAKQARFATAPPSWRQYLWLNFKKPEVPDPSILPKESNTAERTLWKKYIEQGWQQGLQQANSIFAENLSKLKSDYEGMSLYRKLLNENMISAPVIAQTKLGITGDEHSLAINDRFMRITAHPSLNPNGAEWTPAVAQPFITVENGANIKDDINERQPYSK